MWTYHRNHPGYLPDTDEPSPLYITRADAVTALADDMRQWADDTDEHNDAIAGEDIDAGLSAADVRADVDSLLSDLRVDPREGEWSACVDYGRVLPMAWSLVEIDEEALPPVTIDRDVPMALYDEDVDARADVLARDGITDGEALAIAVAWGATFRAGSDLLTLASTRSVDPVRLAADIDAIERAGDWVGTLGRIVHRDMSLLRSWLQDYVDSDDYRMGRA